MKILMICNTDGALYNFRKPIIEELVTQGHEVYSITSSRSPEGSYIKRLQKLGVNTHIVEFDNSVGLFKNITIYKQLSKIIKELSPDIVHNFTHKPAIFGSIAAKMNKVDKIFVSITGLGNLFTKDNLKTKLLRFILLMQYRFASLFVNKIFFQNPDDIDDFVRFKIVSKNKAILTPGSGIDINEFTTTKEMKSEMRQKLSQEIGIDLDNKIILIFPARALQEKGIKEFYQAGKIVTKLSNNYIFLHLGSPSKQAGMDTSTLEAKSKQSNIYYLGYKSNVKEYIIASDVVVLPSYYREGIPRSLLEALALDKIIITTNRPGCKETVIDNWNGRLCEAKNSKDLTSKILQITNENMMKYKNNSRKYAEKFFDSKIIVKLTLKEYFDD